MFTLEPTNRLAKWLHTHCSGHSHYFIHGFFSALTLAPAAMRPSRWLGQLLDGQEPESLPSWVIVELVDLFYQFQQAAYDSELTLPAKCSVPQTDPTATFAKGHPLHAWSLGAQRAVRLWPPFDHLPQQLQPYFAVMAVELMFFCDEARARERYSENESPFGFDGEIRAVCHQLAQHLEYSARLATCRYVELLDQLDEEELDEEGFDEDLFDDPTDEGEWQFFDLPSMEVDLWEEERELALLERDPKLRLSMLDSLIAEARTSLGDAFWNTPEGDRWTRLEARPVLRAMADRIHLLLNANRQDEARTSIYQLLELNGNDNLSIRYPLMDLLHRQRRWAELEALLERYDDASASNLYSRTLMLFARHGDSEAARQALTEAYNTNQQVPALLLGQSRLPQMPPEFYMPGGKDEAILYAHDAKRVWQQTDGALFWLRSRLKK